MFRSEGKLPRDNSKLYIYDTIGELGEIYEICEYVIMGGSFVTKGGHNPIEPAKFRTAIFSGPHYFNFENEYEGLIESKAAKIFKDKIDIDILKNKITNIMQRFFCKLPADLCTDAFANSNLYGSTQSTQGD